MKARLICLKSLRLIPFGLTPHIFQFGILFYKHDFEDSAGIGSDTEAVVDAGADDPDHFVAAVKDPGVFLLRN